MISLLLQVLIWMAGVCLLLTFPVLLWIVCIDLRDRLRRAVRPSERPRCACNRHPLWWDDVPLYHGGWLHEPGRCYPDMAALR